MTEHTRFRFGATSATASMAAGVAALAFAGEDVDPLALTSPQLAPVQTLPAPAGAYQGPAWTAPPAEPLVHRAEALTIRAAHRGWTPPSHLARFPPTGFPVILDGPTGYEAAAT